MGFAAAIVCRLFKAGCPDRIPDDRSGTAARTAELIRAYDASAAPLLDKLESRDDPARALLLARQRRAEGASSSPIGNRIAERGEAS